MNTITIEEHMQELFNLLEWDCEEHDLKLNAMVAQSFSNGLYIRRDNSLIGEVYSLVNFEADNLEEEPFVLGTSTTIEGAWLFAPNYCHDMNLITELIANKSPRLAISRITNIFGNQLFHVECHYESYEGTHSDARLPLAIVGAWLMANVRKQIYDDFKKSVSKKD